MRILFLSAQMPGHLDWGGYLRTAAELARRGHDTLWASGSEVGALVRDAGVSFQELANTGWRWPPPPPLNNDAAPDAESLLLLKQERALDQWLDVARVEPAVAELSDLGADFRPDAIVSEMFVAAAGLAAEQLAAPFVVAGWPAPASTPGTSDPMIDLARSRLREMLSRFGLTGRYWTEQGPPALLSPLLHLTYWSPSWFDGNAMRSQTRHVGGAQPQVRPAPPDGLPSPDADPWVLITLGTSFNRDPNFFIAAAHAARRIGCLPIIVFGDDLETPWIRHTLDRLPEKAVIRQRVDFSSVLPYTSAAIHHGGAGTTHALIVHGVPQIVIPHAADQTRQARGVTRTGVGLHVPPRSATIEALVNGLSAVLPDLSPYRARAGALQDEFRALGGVPAAADLIEQIAT